MVDNVIINPYRDLLTVRQKSDIEIITRMYRQKKNLFDRNDPRESVKDRIVSISKPYVRPIVRNKELARARLTEILYIFFGIHTENIVQLVRREAAEIVQAA